MSKKKIKCYKRINKHLITEIEGEKFNFTIYESNETCTQMIPFLQKENIIDEHKKLQLQEIEHLYVYEDDYKNYKEYAQKIIEDNKEIELSKKASIVYENAAVLMDELFSNPEALGNIDKCQGIVSSFIDLTLKKESTIASIMKIAAHDYYTHTHSINVSIYTLSLSKFIGLKDKDLEDISMASILHDLGKSRIDRNIINKNGKLTKSEFEEIKKHPVYGYDLALNMGITDKRILAGIRSHHEKLDGSGYPDGLKNQQIPLFARIIAVCDVFDALTTKRSYKDAMKSFEAIKLMKEKMSNHLDMKLVNALIQMFKTDCEIGPQQTKEKYLN